MPDLFLISPATIDAISYSAPAILNIDLGAASSLVAGGLASYATPQQLANSAPLPHYSHARLRERRFVSGRSGTGIATTPAGCYAVRVIFTALILVPVTIDGIAYPAGSVVDLDAPTTRDLVSQDLATRSRDAIGQALGRGTLRIDHEQRLMVRFSAPVGSGPPAPVFTVVPFISPTSGVTGATFTATDGTVTNGTVTGRRWLLSGTAIGTGTTVVPVVAGTLVLENTAVGAGGTTVATSAAVTVAAAGAAPNLARALPGLNALSASYYNCVPMQNDWGWYSYVADNGAIFIPYAAINTVAGQAYDIVDTGVSGVTLSSSNSNVTIVLSGPGSNLHRIKVNADESTPIDRYITWTGTKPTKFQVTRNGTTGDIAPEWLASMAGVKFFRNLDMGVQNFTLEQPGSAQQSQSNLDPMSVQVTAAMALLAQNQGFMGIRDVIEVDRTDAQLIARFQAVKTYLDAYPGSAYAPEVGNEVWNLGFSGAKRMYMEGMCRGYYGPATSSALQPALNITYVLAKDLDTGLRSHGANGSPGNTDSPDAGMSTGDLIMYPFNGVGIPVYRAKQSVPAGSEINVNQYFEILYTHSEVVQAKDRYHAALSNHIYDVMATVFTSAQMTNQVFPVMAGQQGISMLDQMANGKAFLPSWYANRVKMLSVAFYSNELSTDSNFINNCTVATMDAAFRAGWEDTKANSVKRLLADCVTDGKLADFYEGGPDPLFALAGNSHYLGVYISYMQTALGQQNSGQTFFADVGAWMRLNVLGSYQFYHAGGDRIPNSNYPYYGLRLHQTDTSADGRWRGWQAGTLSSYLPLLVLSGPFAYAANAGAGSTVANIADVPRGVTPTIVSPNDGRLAIAGNATSGWKVITTSATQTQGTYTLTVGATGSANTSGTVTVGAAITGYRYFRLTPRKLLNGLHPGDIGYRPSLGEVAFSDSGGAISHATGAWTASLVNGSTDSNSIDHVVDNDANTSWIAVPSDGSDAAKDGTFIIDFGPSTGLTPTQARLTWAHETTSASPAQFNIAFSKDRTAWTTGYDTGSVDATYTSGVCTLSISLP